MAAGERKTPAPDPVAPAKKAAKKKKPAPEKGPAAPGPAPAAPAARPAAAEIPFQELSRDAASAFLYAALMPEEVLGLVKQLGLGVPGFRPEGLGDVERCDLVADELRAAPRSRGSLQAVLEKALQEPAFATSSLDPSAADELLEVAGSDHGLAIALWRVLADPHAEVRARGAAALERLAKDWYGPAPAGAQPAGTGPGGEAGAAGPAPKARGEGGDGGLQALQERLARAEARVEAERERGEAKAEKLQAQVKEARVEAARLAEEASRSRAAADGARAALARAEVALAAARAGDGAAEATRLKGALREAEVALHAAEARAARAEEREGALQETLRRAEARAEAASAGAASPAVSLQEPDGEPEEAPATWLLPVFTDEFYDSLSGWDRRIQRAALKQAFLLSQDHRHPSLRALPLEGLPGYYRVRVATDVRLIYRRGERQDTVELCSLIDREDLDRYVRQAKTR